MKKLLSNLTIGKRVALGFFAVTAVAVSLGAFAYLHLRAIDANADILTDDALPGMALSAKIDVATTDNYSFLLRHMATESDTEKADLEARSQKVRSEVS